MQNLQNGNGLCPFRKLPHTAVDMLEPNQGDEENDAAKDSQPQDGRGKIVEYEILRLELTPGAFWAIHGLIEKSNLVGVDQRIVDFMVEILFALMGK